MMNEGDEAYTTNLCQKCFNNNYRQKEKNCLMCSGDRKWKKSVSWNQLLLKILLHFKFRETVCRIALARCSSQDSGDVLY